MAFPFLRPLFVGVYVRACFLFFFCVCVCVCVCVFVGGFAGVVMVVAVYFLLSQVEGK